jgi:hypothetical protein
LTSQEIVDRDISIYPFYYFLPHEFRDDVHTTNDSIKHLLFNMSLDPFATNEWGTTHSTYLEWEAIPKDFLIDLTGYQSIDQWILEPQQKQKQ